MLRLGRVGVLKSNPLALRRPPSELPTIMKLTAIIIALAGATYFSMQLFLDHAVEQGIETIGPHLTGTEIELREVDLTLLSGKGSVRGLVVGNPPGFQTDNAFELEEVRIDLAPLSVLSGTIVIE